MFMFKNKIMLNDFVQVLNDLMDEETIQLSGSDDRLNLNLPQDRPFIIPGTRQQRGPAADSLQSRGLAGDSLQTRGLAVGSLQSRGPADGSLPTGGRSGQQAPRLDRRHRAMRGRDTFFTLDAKIIRAQSQG